MFGEGSDHGVVGLSGAVSGLCSACELSVFWSLLWCLTLFSHCLQILHFFNTPPGLDEETLKQVFMEGEVVEPKSIKLFPSKSECEDL